MTTESTNTPVVACRDVGRTFRQGHQEIRVLQHLNCEIGEGDLVAVVGASGSGKSTLLNLMGGLDDPDSGEVLVRGQPLRPLSESRRAAWRNRHLGFVYQFHHLLPEFSALENVAIPNMIAGLSRREAEAAAADLLGRVGLDHRLDHRPSALSGGERQRVAIARSLATRPACVLMDEPTGNLDPVTAASVFDLLLTLNAELRISFVIVTHDPAIAARMQRTLQLDDGRLQTRERPLD